MREGLRLELVRALRPKREEAIYGDVTQRIVAVFQEERRIDPSGSVDESTADARNALLRERGMLEGEDSYRVWEANQKICLFPENWLEPEFRDDKTSLFGELEGTLLKDDVSSDMVEDTFLNYLRKLEELARLNMVAMHLESKDDPANNVLHVIGRTYSSPYKHFYRRFAHQVWTPWEPVTTEIEGDHLVPVIWRDRLYLFWVTFLERAGGPVVPASASNKKVGELPLAQTVTEFGAVGVSKTVDVQLHWTEYLQGQWSTHESSGFPASITSSVPSSFHPGSVFVHVTLEKSGGGVYIYLSEPIGRGFFLAGRNSTPQRVDYDPPPASPYSANDRRATLYEGKGSLEVTFVPRITTEAGKAPARPTETPSILRQADPGGSHILAAGKDIVGMSPFGLVQGLLELGMAGGFAWLGKQAEAGLRSTSETLGISQVERDWTGELQRMYSP